MPAKTETANSEELIITRTFNAPRELVFSAFAKAENLAKWWGPKGFEIAVSQFEFKPGGVFHYSMTSADGFVMWGKSFFQEIVAPERISFINGFSNEQGDVTRPPFEDAWPQEILNSFTFSEENGQTILQLSVVAINASNEEKATFESGFSSMQEGYGGTFDKLDVFLASETTA